MFLMLLYFSVHVWISYEDLHEETFTWVSWDIRLAADKSKEREFFEWLLKNKNLFTFHQIKTSLGIDFLLYFLPIFRKYYFDVGLSVRVKIFFCTLVQEFVCRQSKKILLEKHWKPFIWKRKTTQRWKVIFIFSLRWTTGFHLIS